MTIPDSVVPVWGVIPLAVDKLEETLSVMVPQLSFSLSFPLVDQISKLGSAAIDTPSIDLFP